MREQTIYLSEPKKSTAVTFKATHQCSPLMATAGATFYTAVALCQTDPTPM